MDITSCTNHIEFGVIYVQQLTVAVVNGCSMAVGSLEYRISMAKNDRRLVLLYILTYMLHDDYINVKSGIIKPPD